MKKSHMVLLIMTLFYLAVYSVYYIWRKNYEFGIYVFVIFCIVLVISRRKNMNYFDDIMLWGISFFGLVHLVAGSLIVDNVVLYGYKLYPFLDYGGEFYILKFDQVVHLYGYVIVGMMMYALLAKSLVRKTHPLFILCSAILVSMGLGVGNEIVEFFVFTLIKDNGVGGMYNLGLDFIFNFMGALIGVFLQFFRGSYHGLAKPLKTPSE